jgi:adenylate cyclase
MPPQKACSPEFVRTELEKILSSRGFAHNDRLSGFFRFVVEQELFGRGDELKESIIGVECFGRRPDYDVRQDSVVRNEAGKLRSRLAEYYVAEGAADRLIIELPKGGYKPAFRHIEKATAPVPGPARSRSRVWIWLAAALAGCAIMSAVLWRRGIQRRNAPIPIAVLPLINLDRNPDHDYFADGLTGEIIRNLSIIDGLAVRSQTSSFAFKGKTQNVHEVGKQLDAEYVLEGSVLHSGQQLRISAQLVRVRDDYPLWSGKYDRELTDVFAIQDEISRGIVNGLRLKLERGRRRYETNAEAYDLYLRARALRVQLGINGYNQGIAPLEKAIGLDHTFAPAYAALAVAYVMRSGQFHLDIADQETKMRSTAEEAIRLDPLLPEAHYALAMSYSRDAQWRSAERSFRRAIELNPADSVLHYDFAFHFLFPLGRKDEALRELRIAENLDPLNAEIHYETAFVLMAIGRYAEAESHCNRLPPEFSLKNECLAWARLGQGKVNEVIEAAERALDRPRMRGAPLRAALGCAYARAGRRQDAAELAKESTFNAFNEAHILVCLGDTGHAFEALDRATAAGPIRIGRKVEAPEFATLRRDPRLGAIRKKVGLPE